MSPFYPESTHVTSKEELIEFFIITPLGLEEICREEMTLKAPQIDVDFVVPGGVSIKANLEQGLSLNFILKTPTRILMRVGTFKARAFPQLFQKIEKFPWRNWMWGPSSKIHVTAKKSRLIHSNRISDTIKSGLEKYFKAQPSGKELPGPELFVRAVDDIFTLSLDTSGGPLYERSGMEFRGKAGIRESIAYCLLFKLRKSVNSEKIMDPMCGSGTFLFEAFHFHEPNALKEDQKLLKNFPLKTPKQDLPQFKEISGSDQDAKIISQTKAQLPKEIHLNACDLFKINQDLKETLVILNPPYGERIKIEGDLKEFYQKVLNHLFSLKPKGIGIIIPQTVKGKFDLGGYKITSKTPFSNSGIKVNFFVINQ